MTNTELLNDWIKKSGKKVGFLAEQCGLSLGGFYNCRNNKAEWKASHIQILCNELGIDDPSVRQAIFFAVDVA